MITETDSIVRYKTKGRWEDLGKDGMSTRTRNNLITYTMKLKKIPVDKRHSEVCKTSLKNSSWCDIRRSFPITFMC